MTRGMSDKVKRVWVQNVDANVSLLEARLEVSRARRRVVGERYRDRLESEHAPHDEDLEERLAAESALDSRVQELLDRARRAALRQEPAPNRLVNWWGGRLIEASYQNLHAAEALIVGLYDWDEVEAETPEAIARVEAGLGRDDLRKTAAEELLRDADPPLALPQAKAQLRKTIEIGHAAADRDHSRLRSFRNAVVAAAFLLALLVTLFGMYVWFNDAKIPLCFTPPNAENQPPTWVCPTGEYEWDPDTPTVHGDTSSHDVVLVGLLGIMGGAFSAAVAIRNLTGTSTPYDVPLALAALKVPLGALTAIGGLIALQGDFVPGLSELDSQGQILAYALVFGYAQQLLTGLLDKRAESLLAAAPGKEKSVDRPDQPYSRSSARRPRVAQQTPVRQRWKWPSRSRAAEKDDM